MLRGKDKYETFENVCIGFIIVGGILLSSGMGLTIISPKGASAIIAMFGSFLIFLFTLFLILVWLVKEFR